MENQTYDSYIKHITMKKFPILTLVFLGSFLGVQGQTSTNVMQTGSGSSSTPFNDDYNYVDEDEGQELVTSSSSSTTTREKTLTFLKELRNITRDAGDFLKLRCEVSGTVPATRIDWFKNDAPVIEEKNRMKIKTSLDGNIQWSQLKFRSLETLDTAFYECRASNGLDTIKSIAIITVELVRRGQKNKFHHGNQDEDDDTVGLLPETYSDPAFPGMDNIEFEGGQRPNNFGNNNNKNWFGGNNRNDNSKKKHSQAPGNDLRSLGGSIPNLEPNARSGTCQPYVGSVCAKYVGQEYVFITEGLTQDYIEKKLTAALTVITASPDLSESCSHYAIPSICLSTLPICDRRTEKPREMCREECELLEDQLCRKELAIARQHALVGTQMVLPVCNKLPPVGSPGASTCVAIGIPQVR